MKSLKIAGIIMSLIHAWSTVAFAAEKSKSAGNKSGSTQASKPGNAMDAEQLNVDSIKEKYWARGDETEVGHRRMVPPGASLRTRVRLALQHLGAERPLDAQRDRHVVERPAGFELVDEPETLLRKGEREIAMSRHGYERRQYLGLLIAQFLL